MLLFYQTYSETFDDSLLEKAGKLQTELDQGVFYQIDTLVAEMSSGLGIECLRFRFTVEKSKWWTTFKGDFSKTTFRKPRCSDLDEPTNH